MSRWLATCLTLLALLVLSAPGCKLSDPPRKRAVASGEESDVQQPPREAQASDVVATTPELQTRPLPEKLGRPIGGRIGVARTKLGAPRMARPQLRIDGARKLQGIRDGSLQPLGKTPGNELAAEPVPGTALVEPTGAAPVPSEPAIAPAEPEQPSEPAAPAAPTE